MIREGRFRLPDEHTPWRYIDSGAMRPGVVVVLLWDEDDRMVSVDIALEFFDNPDIDLWRWVEPVVTIKRSDLIRQSVP